MRRGLGGYEHPPFGSRKENTSSRSLIFIPIVIILLGFKNVIPTVALFKVLFSRER
jgi:hypothetical protein